MKIQIPIRDTKDIWETFDPKDIKDFRYSKEMRNTKDIMETKNIRDAKGCPGYQGFQLV